MSLYSKGGEQYNHQLNNAFDGDYDIYWRSIGIQVQNLQIQKHKKYMNL